MIWFGMVVALAVGIWIGVGAPGLPGAREDEYKPHGSRRRMKKRAYVPLDWLKGPGVRR
ncbi:MAG: hypothetical protein WEA24_05840 [Gemmatimonadota bacterium]